MGHATVVIDMIDIRLVRDDSAAVKLALGRRGIDPAEVDRLVQLDGETRAAIGRRDEFRSEIKSLSKQVGEARRAGDVSTADELAAKSRELGEEERLVGTVAETAQDAVRQALLFLPNLPSVDTPDGGGPEDNVVAKVGPRPLRSTAIGNGCPTGRSARRWGSWTWSVGPSCPGRCSPCIVGPAHDCSAALTSFALDSHADAFEEIRPPTMVLTETMISTGHLPKFEEDAYHIERDDLWAIPTAEVPLASMWRGDIVDEARPSDAPDCCNLVLSSRGRLCGA